MFINEVYYCIVAIWNIDAGSFIWSYSTIANLIFINEVHYDQILLTSKGIIHELSIAIYIDQRSVAHPM